MSGSILPDYPKKKKQSKGTLPKYPKAKKKKQSKDTLPPYPKTGGKGLPKPKLGMKSMEKVKKHLKKFNLHPKKKTHKVSEAIKYLKKHHKKVIKKDTPFNHHKESRIITETKPHSQHYKVSVNNKGERTQESLERRKRRTLHVGKPNKRRRKNV
jgi:hypothetical protein